MNVGVFAFLPLPVVSSSPPPSAIMHSATVLLLACMILSHLSLVPLSILIWGDVHVPPVSGGVLLPTSPGPNVRREDEENELLSSSIPLPSSPPTLLNQPHDPAPSPVSIPAPPAFPHNPPSSPSTLPPHQSSSSQSCCSCHNRPGVGRRASCFTATGQYLNGWSVWDAVVAYNISHFSTLLKCTAFVHAVT